MKTLLLIRGLPGAGKSSFVELLEDMGADIRAYAADDWMVNEKGDYKWESGKIKESHDHCRASVEWDMSDDIPFIAVHNTFTTETEIEPYTTLAKKYGYRVVSVVLENRHKGTSIHAVPETTIKKMQDRFMVKL